MDVIMTKRWMILFAISILLFSCGSLVAGSRAPGWILSVDSVFNRNQYVAATGFGNDRGTAEKNAMASLVSYFGQTLEVERTAVSQYEQAIVNGVMDSWIDTVEMRSNIRTTASMENLMGAEIREVWFDSRDTYYAVAVMEKESSIGIYTELIRANQNIINNLITMTPNEKNSLEGVIRYRFAATTADITAYYRNIVSLLGGTVSGAFVNGDQYRLEAMNITRTIPIGIRINNDRNGRIYGAFARCFASYGFDASSANSRYVLNVNVVISPVDLPANPNVFSRIEIDALLRDTGSGLVLLPYNFNSREGHTSMANAENRALSAAEQNISDNFNKILSDYLTSLNQVSRN